MNEKKRLIKNTGWIAIGNMGAKVLSFLLLPLYTSILTTSEYGTYDFIVAISAFLLPVVTVSMHEAMFRFIIEKSDDQSAFKHIISNAFIIIMLGILLLWGIVFVISLFYQYDYYVLLLLYVTANVLYIFAVNLLRGLGRIKQYALISSARNILQLVLNVLAVAVLKWGLKGLIFSMCISEIMAFLVVAVLVKIWRYIRFSFFSTQLIREMLKYSIPLIPNSVGAQIINVSDRLIISATIGAGANGIYSISYKFPNIIETVYHYFYTAWSESASRVIEKGKEKAEEYYQEMYKTIDNLVFSLVIVMVAMMPILFRVLIKGDYTEGFIYIPILMFAMYFDSIAKFYSGIFTALKHTKVMATSTVIASIINIVINIGMIYRFGLFAAAISTLISEIVLWFIRMKTLQNNISLPIRKNKVVIELFVAFTICYFYSFTEWKKTIVNLLIASIYAIYTNRQMISKVLLVVKKKFNK